MICSTCDGTGLIAVPWKGWDKGKEVTLYDRNRKTCPQCRGERATE